MSWDNRKACKQSVWDTETSSAWQKPCHCEEWVERMTRQSRTSNRDCFASLAITNERLLRRYAPANDIFIKVIQRQKIWFYLFTIYFISPKNLYRLPPSSVLFIISFTQRNVSSKTEKLMKIVWSMISGGWGVEREGACQNFFCFCGGSCQIARLPCGSGGISLAWWRLLFRSFGSLWSLSFGES